MTGLSVTTNSIVVHHSHGLSCVGKFDVLHANSVIHFKAVRKLKSNQRRDKIKHYQVKNMPRDLEKWKKQQANAQRAPSPWTHIGSCAHTCITFLCLIHISVNSMLFVLQRSCPWRTTVTEVLLHLNSFTLNKD